MNELTKDKQKYLQIIVAKYRYLIQIDYIREIIEYGDITTVPNTPEFIHGMINLRGDYIPVIDLNARLNNQPDTINKKSCIVIVNTEQLEANNENRAVGILVSQVKSFIEVDVENQGEPPKFGSVIREDFMDVIVNLGETSEIVLNMNTVIDFNELKAAMVE